MPAIRVTAVWGENPNPAVSWLYISSASIGQHNVGCPCYLLPLVITIRVQLHCWRPDDLPNSPSNKSIFIDILRQNICGPNFNLPFASSCYFIIEVDLNDVAFYWLDEKYDNLELLSQINKAFDAWLTSARWVSHPRMSVPLVSRNQQYLGTKKVCLKSIP